MYVSVVVPTFNSAKTICNVLEDLKPVKNVEVIISDDGSTDNTVDEVREYRYKNDFPVTILENEHYGVSYARNQGIHVSKGRYLCFIDSDDRVNSEAFSDIISNVDDSDIISCTEGVPVSKNTDFPIAEKIIDDLIRKGNCEYYLASPFAKLYNSDFIQGNGILFDESVNKGEDLLFNLKCLVLTNNVTFVRPYYHYVHRPGSITRSFRKDLFPNSAAYVMAADQILRASSLSKEKIMVYTKLVQTTSWYRDALSGISTGHSIAEVLNFMRSCEATGNVDATLLSTYSFKEKAVAQLLTFHLLALVKLIVMFRKIFKS